MGEALLAGLIAAGWQHLAVVEAVAGRRDELAGRFPDVEVRSEPGGANGTVVAVKPQDIESALRAVAATQPARVLSIAAGVRLARLEAGVGEGVPVVRAMPNTPALVGAGAAAVAGGSVASDDDLVWAEQILGAVGVVVRVPEKLLDAVTGLSGSGPAYVFLLAEALIDGGVAAGLPRDVAEALTTQTLLGSARLLAESDEGPEQLRAQVTSPGGTTAEALAVLEDADVRAAFIEAVQAATRRSEELGQG